LLPKFSISFFKDYLRPIFTVLVVDCKIVMGVREVYESAS